MRGEDYYRKQGYDKGFKEGKKEGARDKLKEVGHTLLKTMDSINKSGGNAIDHYEKLGNILFKNIKKWIGIEKLSGSVKEVVSDVK